MESRDRRWAGMRASAYLDALLIESVSQVFDCAGQATFQNPMDDGPRSVADASLLLCPCRFALLASFLLRYGKNVDSTSHSMQPEIGRRAPNWRSLVGPALDMRCVIRTDTEGRTA